MRAFIYYLTLPLIYLISYSHPWVLYRLSDVFYILVYKLLGYRKNVVSKNLHKSFPEKTEKELKTLEATYFKYMFDILVESIKTLTITEKYVRNHLKFNNRDLVENLYKEGKSMIIVMGHYGNWELAGPCFSLNCSHQLNVVYKPLTNKYFEGLFSRARTKFGTKIIPMKNTLRAMVANKEKVDATAFIADQSPGGIGHWLEFLNQDTLVFTGPEKMSKMFNYPVVYMHVDRVKRGYYEINPLILHNNPKETIENEITSAFFKQLEKDIHTKPETWLWSHRRWKHQRTITSEQ